MRHLFLIISSSLLLTAFSSCKKDRVDQPTETVAPAKPKRLLKETTFHSFKSEFEYNADSTVHKRATTIPGYNPELSVYTYDNNTFKEQILRNGVPFWESTLTLANGRLANEHVQYIGDNGEILQDNQIAYVYNEKGLLSELIWDGGPFKRVFTYDANNNMIARKEYTVDGYNGVREYSYTNLVDKYPSFSHFYTDGWGQYKPAMSKHLVKRLTVKDKNGVVTQDISYDYQLDADGYVTGGTQYDHLLNTSRQWTNIYQ